ncbi:diguanylate cyclase domain-containing protein [Aliidiomarina shirensis]|nr:diguanylate cyclase [Aliidiomarina shirensis]
MRNPLHNRRVRFSRRLTTHLLVRISFWSLLAVLIITTIGFVISYKHAKEALITALIEDTNQHLARESEHFRTVEQSATVLAERFLTRYQEFINDDRFQERFDRWYTETEPGVVRLQPEFYDGIRQGETWFENITVFAGPRTNAISDELKARVTIAQYVLNELAPAWLQKVKNTHISMPENIMLVYSETQPWGLVAAADLVITDYSVVQSTLMEYNPERKPGWTGLYYDLSADFWTITYQHPVDYQGQHLMNASYDIALSDIIDRVIQYQSDSDKRMLFNTKGQLIASPETLSESYQQRGVLDIDKLSNPEYKAIYQLIEAHGADTDHFVLRNALPGELLIGQKISGLNWWHVTLYPYSQVQLQALQGPLRISLATIGLLIFILLIVYWLVSRHVSRPLRQLANMAMMIGEKNYADVISSKHLQEHVRSEVGLLVRSFRTMASRLLAHQQNLEKLVADRTAQLAAANEALEQMAHLDGLTGLRNRRAFDKDMARLSAHPHDTNTTLLLGDLDKFKPFNDNYGHQAGDEALKNVAKCLANFEQVRVYRYGGEEIAVLADVADYTAAKQLAEAMCKAVFDLNIAHKHCEHKRLTISFGVHLVVNDSSIEANIQAVDKQLYEAKKAGGNCVR